MSLHLTFVFGGELNKRRQETSSPSKLGINLLNSLNLLKLQSYYFVHFDIILISWYFIK